MNVVPNADRYPVLRLAFPVDHGRAVKQDRTLRRLSRWASNIVRLPLNDGGFASLEEQIRGFPAEFLLFAEHVGRLTLRVWPKKNVCFSVSYDSSGEELNGGDEEPGLRCSDHCLEVFRQSPVSV